MAKVLENVVLRAQKPFKNEAVLDFSKEEDKRAQADAIARVKSELGQTYPLIIGGKKITNATTFASVNPLQPDQVGVYFSSATIEQTHEAVQVAATAFERWKHVSAEERAGYLFAAAGLLRERRYYFTAWMLFEVGTSWV